MIKKRGYEIIIGAKTDPLFGPVILFGMGGIGVELFKDFPQLKEVDINPLFINENDATIIDARTVIDREKVFQKLEPHQHLVISPYPKKYETLWKMRDGRTVLLRPIKPEDEPLWLEMFRNFSEESIRFRFFQIIKDTPHEMRVKYCNIDYDREIAIVAELTKDRRRKILGVVRVSLEPDRKSGEIAFIMADPWQALGLGTKMVDYTVEICKDMGVETLYGIMLPDNHRAINLTKKMGFTLRYQEDGTVKGILNFKEETSIQCQETKSSKRKRKIWQYSLRKKGEERKRKLLAVKRHTINLN